MTEPRSVDAYVDRLVREAPPLTADQLDRLALLLRPAPERRAAA